MNKLFIVPLLFLISCHSKKQETPYTFYNNARLITDSQFKQLDIVYNTISIPGFTDSTSFSALNFIGDNIVLIDRKKRILIFDKKFSLVKEFSEKSPEHILLISPRSIVEINSKEFLVHDLTMNVLYDFYFEPKTKTWTNKRKIQLEENLHGLISIDKLIDSNFIATSINNIDGKLIKFQIDPIQKINNYFGKIPTSIDTNKYITGMEYRSSCSYDSLNKGFFIGHFYTDVIEFYNTKGDLLYKLHGPDNFSPIFKMEKKFGKNVFIHTKNTKTGYLSLTTDKNYLYALYSGKSLMDQNHKSIYIFTKQGEPYKKINLNININDIKIDKKTNRLYGFHIADNSKEYLIYFDTKNI